MTKVYSDPEEMPQGFHKAECAICNRTTWHYKQGKAVHCSDHSDWSKPAPHRKIEGNIIMGTLGKSKPEPMTETAMRIANRLDRSLWRHAEERSKVAVVIGDEDWAQGMFPESDLPKLDPDKIYCTFCGDEVDRIHLTSERKPVIRKIMDAWRDESGEIHQQEKVISRAETINACPNCCLKVRKPITVRRV